MTDRTNPIDGVFRRTVVKASAVAMGTLGMIGSATGDEHDEEEKTDDTNDNDVDDEYGDPDENDVDEPDGFEVDIFAPHASFPDDVSARFCLEFAEEHEDDPIVVDMDDASTVLTGEVIWEEGGRSGWHRHPGMAIVNMVEGEVEVTWEFDCVPRTYEAGDAWIDPGEIHNAESEEGALAYVTFLDIPDGEPATEWVEPRGC
jgi:quercetin dioxygenase-like cupin family protein